MEDADFSNAELTGTEIYTKTRDLVGTVAAVDEEANALLVAPNPAYVDEASGARVDDDTAVSRDPNWIANPQVEVEEVPEDAYASDAEEWPFTLGPEDVEEIDEDGIRLRL